MYLSFELRELRFFLVVAEEENLGRAAARLNVTASPLSRRIRELEARLDLQLFQHEKKRVKLTSAGRAFAREVRSFLQQAEELQRRASDLRSGIGQSLHIGYVPGAMSGGLLPETISALRKSHREVQFRLHAMRSREQINALHRGAIDLALVHRPPESADGLRVLLLERDPFALVVPRNSPLTRIPSARDLAKQSWITLAEGYSPTFRQDFLQACRQLGFEPNIQHQSEDIPSLIGLIESGLGVGLLQSKLSRICPTSVRVMPFPKFPLSVALYGVHRADQLPGVGESFLALARRE
ncbi:MAG: LysR substrate-binding domain-containing protein [Pseudomonadota bacterium]